jgi:type II secretion system protein N
VAGYGALFAVLFFIFLYLTFPFNAIRDTIAKQIESRGNLRVIIDDISPFRLTGIRIKGLKLSDAADPTQVYLNLNEVRVRVRPTQLLLGRVWLDFDVYAYDGGAAGSYCKRGPVSDVALNFVGLRLAKYGMREVVRKFGSMDLDGMLSGQFELHYNPAVRRNNSGLLSLSVDKMKASHIVILNNKLPDLVFEPGKISFKMQNQAFSVDQFNLKSNNLEMTMTGRVTLADIFRNSRVFLNLRLKPSDEMESALGIIMMGVKQPDANGFYTISLNGTPGNMHTR